MNKVEIFACLVSALAHDIGHPGLNNQFLINTNHELTQIHHDISPLENMHISLLFNILKHSQSNIMSGLSKQQWLDARKQMIICILNTDMAYHFDNLKKLEVFEEMHGDEVRLFNSQRNDPTLTQCEIPTSLTNRDHRLLLQQSLLHAGDLNNPVKIYKIYNKWIKRVTEEFFHQGEKEKELGLPISPNFDRETTSIPSMQLGFIEFIIRPYFAVLVKLFPDDLGVLKHNLERNYQHFKTMRAHEQQGGVSI